MLITTTYTKKINRFKDLFDLKALRMCFFTTFLQKQKSK